ncbi:MAG: oligosaccharide flippase family protein [Bacteroidota bacterium]|jgi:O-antigen/teichoic acid export membrane protein
MQRKFLSSLLLTILLNLLIKPLAIFGIDATVQNSVATEDYGLYFSLLNLSFLFNILLDLGVNNFTTRHVAQYPHLVSNYWGRLIGLRLLFFLLYSAVTFGVALISGYSSYAFFLLTILVFNQLLVTFIAYFRSHFGGLHLFKTDAIISVLDRFLLIVFCGILLYTPWVGTPFRIEWFIWIQTLCYGLTLITAAVIMIRRTGWPRLGFDSAFSLVILRKSFPYALLILLMMIYTRTDSVMLERIHPNGAYEAGVYAQGFRLLDALFMFGMIFANLLLPIFSRMLAEKKELSGLLATSRELLVGGALFIGFFCQVHAHDILDLIYTKEIEESVSSFRLLMWVFTGMSLSLVYGTLLTAAGDLRAMNVISLIGVITNVALNCLLIPQHGAQGAALATLITQGSTAVAQMIVAHSKLKLNWSFNRVISYALFVSLMSVLIVVGRHWHYFMLLQFFSGIVFLFLLKLIDLKSLFRLFSDKEE